MAMTDEEASRVIAGEMADRDARNAEYIAATTFQLAALLLIYGLTALIWSDSIWAPSGVHVMFLDAPGAPESWGCLFVALGTALAVAQLQHWRRTLLTLLSVSTLLFATFMGGVLISGQFPRGVGTAVMYGTFSAIFLHRLRNLWRS